MNKQISSIIPRDDIFSINKILDVLAVNLALNDIIKRI